jgi:hypothetical protein
MKVSAQLRSPAVLPSGDSVLSMNSVFSFKRRVDACTIQHNHTHKPQVRPGVSYLTPR